MKPLLDFFRLGLAIGQETRDDTDILDRLLQLERPSEAAQFVVIGALVGHSRTVEAEALLEKLEAENGETGAVG